MLTQLVVRARSARRFVVDYDVPRKGTCSAFTSGAGIGGRCTDSNVFSLAVLINQKVDNFTDLCKRSGNK